MSTRVPLLFMPSVRAVGVRPADATPADPAITPIARATASHRQRFMSLLLFARTAVLPQGEMRNCTMPNAPARASGGPAGLRGLSIAPALLAPRPLRRDLCAYSSPAAPA